MLEICRKCYIFVNINKCIFNFDLIAAINGLPTKGENPEQYLEDKTKEKSISDEIKENYGTMLQGKSLYGMG
jgi:hypothetical protein